MSGNLSARAGGGIYSVSPATITNSTIDNNSAGASGGGIHNETEMTLMNSTVSRNTSRLRDGGGIYNHIGYPGPRMVINSTVSDNSAPHGSGSGINNDNATMTLKNSIVANGGLGGDCFNEFGGATVSEGYNLDSDGTCNLTATGDLPNASPNLKPLALNAPGNTETQALGTFSPAIDHIPAGVNGCGTTISADQRGVSRPQGSGCDIGAYELEPPPPGPAPVGGFVTLPVSGASGSESLAWPIALAGAAVTVLGIGWWHRRRTLG